MSIRCKNKACGWYKSFADGNYKSNCKMAGVTNCDFNETVTQEKIQIVPEPTTSPDTVDELKNWLICNEGSDYDLEIAQTTLNYIKFLERLVEGSK